MLNQLMGKKGGFTVGPTVKACTKGIWLWGRALTTDAGGTHILFLDTEGLGSTVRSETYDVRIFALALLLSSFFVYNSFGTIDGNAISKLSLVVNLTKHIHVRAQGVGREDSGTEFNQFFPTFLWIVRDFSVKLEKDGRKISARDYLEDALRPEEGLSEAIEQKNAVRLLLRNFFPDRDCLTMVRPVSDEKQLMNLSQLPAEALRPEFRAQIDTLRRKVFGAVRPKTLYGKPLNGAMLASLAVAYCNALNSNQAPTISTAWDRVVDTQCQDAVEGAVNLYVTRMRAAAAEAAAKRRTANASASAAGGVAGATAPGNLAIMEEDELLAAHAECSQAAARFFHVNAVQDPDKTPPFEAALREQVSAEFSRIRRANDAASADVCQSLLERLHEGAVARLRGAGSLTAAPQRPSGRHSARSGGSGSASSSSSIPPSAAPAADAVADERSGVAAATSSAVAATASAVVASASVANAYRDTTEWLQNEYAAAARGPARHRALAEYLAARLPAALIEASLASDESYGAHIAALGRRTTELYAAVSAARGHEQATKELLAQERKSKEAALAEATRQGAETAERLRLQVEARSAELARLSERFDKLLASSEAAAVRADEAAATAATDLAAAHARIDALQSAKVTGLVDVATLSQRLAEAESARSEAERLAAELRLRVGDESRAAAVLLERVRAAENETVRLREQTEMLYESVRVQKDLLAAKNDEKEECEYQWGAAKARLAETEAQRLALQSQYDTLSAVATQMKAWALKASKGSTKGLTFDKLEQRCFDAL